MALALGARMIEGSNPSYPRLLNIANNTDKCFNMAECGQNVLSLLPLITNGNILWEYPVLHYLGNTECDIKIHNKHFTDFKSFLAYTMDGKE